MGSTLFQFTGTQLEIHILRNPNFSKQVQLDNHRRGKGQPVVHGAMDCSQRKA